MWNSEPDPFRKQVRIGSGAILEDKSKFLIIKRLEREAREKLRIQQNAAVAVQKIWRGHRIRRSVGVEISRSLNVRLADLQKLSGILDRRVFITSLLNLTPRLVTMISLAQKMTLDNSAQLLFNLLGDNLPLIDDAILLNFLPLMIPASKPALLSALVTLLDRRELLERFCDTSYFHELVKWALVNGDVAKTGVVISRVLPLAGEDAILAVLDEKDTISRSSKRSDLIRRFFEVTAIKLKKTLISANFTENFDLLISIAAEFKFPGLDELIWRLRWLVKSVALRSAIPSLIVSIASTVHDDDFFGILGPSLFNPAILRILAEKIKDEFGAFVNPIDAGNALAKRMNEEFTRALVLAFSKMWSGTLRTLYAHEMIDGSRNPLSVQVTAFVALTLNRACCLSLLRNVADEAILSAAAVVRLIWDRRRVLGLDAESNWLVADALPDASFNVDFIANSLENADDADQGSSTVSDRGLANVLRHLPHVIAFKERVKIFQSMISLQQERLESSGARMPWARSDNKIRRDHIFEDGIAVFSGNSRQGLHDRIRIIFVRDDGSLEPGIDGGGLFKEFLHAWLREVTRPDNGVFKELPGGQVFPVGQDANIFFAVGRAVGKALFELLLNDTRLSSVFLARVVGVPWSVDELEELDPELHRNLLKLKETPKCEDLGLTFSTVREQDGMHIEVDLIQNGQFIPVTDANKIMYIHKLARYKVVTEISAQARAFTQGFADIISMDGLKLFSPSELQLLMAGEDSRGFNVSDLAKYTNYSGYGRFSTTVQLFWDVVEKDFSPNDQSALLSFVTSSPRAPLLGFKVLSPQFTIHKVPDAKRLPTASTCVNLLKLPAYEDRQTLKDKLLQAVHSGAGFDFS